MTMRILSAVILIAIVAIPISNVHNLKRDGSIEAFLKNEDPALLAYNEFRHQFGQDGEIIVAVHSNNIFSTSFLKQLHRLQ